MQQEYKGWIIESRRVGIRGEFFGSADSVDHPGIYLNTRHYGGVGAKKRALERIKNMVDNAVSQGYAFIANWKLTHK